MIPTLKVLAAAGAAALMLAACGTAGSSTHSSLAHPTHLAAATAAPTTADPVSTSVCRIVKSELNLFTGPSGNISFSSLSVEGQIGDNLSKEANSIPDSEGEADGGTSLKLDLDIFSQQLLLASRGGPQPGNSSSIAAINSDCEDLGVANVLS